MASRRDARLDSRFERKASLTGDLFSVEPLERLGDLPVVSFEDRPCGVRHLFAHQRTTRTDERVAAADVAFQEREGQARIDRLHPEAHFADLDRQRVHVDTVDAPPDDVAECVLVVVRRGCAPRPDARDAIGEPARRREQEVPGPAGGVDDRQLEKGIDGTLGMSVDRALDHGIEGAREEELHELVRGVVAAGRLPCMTPALAGARKGEGTSVAGNLRDKLEKALVDVAELVRTHVAPVHANEPRGLAKPRQTEEGAEESAVLQLRRIEIRALLRREQAGEGGQPEPRFAACKAPEDDRDGIPEIAMAIVGAPADGPVAKAAETVSIGIEPAGRLDRTLRVQQVPFFDREQEDEPIDESQELPEVALLRELPRSAARNEASCSRGGKGSPAPGSRAPAGSRRSACRAPAFPPAGRPPATPPTGMSAAGRRPG